MKYNIGITGTGSLIGQSIIKSIKNSEFSSNYNLIGKRGIRQYCNKYNLGSFYFEGKLMQKTAS